MNNKNDISEELEKEAPFLSKIKRENHFTTPKNYFESLPEVIDVKKLNKRTLKFSFDKLSYRILIPSLSLILIFAILFNWSNPSTEYGLSNEQLSELIISDNYLELDDYLIYAEYAEIIDHEEGNTSTQTEGYIEYLIENNIDINSIVEEIY